MKHKLCEPSTSIYYLFMRQCYEAVTMRGNCDCYIIVRRLSYLTNAGGEFGFKRLNCERGSRCWQKLIKQMQGTSP